jgi:hypothetical protein
MKTLASAPMSATPLENSSGNVANASAVATLAAAAGKRTFISGLIMQGGGATAASLVSPTITGLLGGTMTLTYGAVAGVTLKNNDIHITFNPPLPASADNTAIVATLPALGAGNTNASCTAWGFQLDAPVD